MQVVTVPVYQVVPQNLGFDLGGALGIAKDSVAFGQTIAGMVGQQEQQQMQLQNLGGPSADEILRATGQGLDLVGKIGGGLGLFEQQQQMQLQNLDPSPEEIMKATGEGIKLASEIFKMFGQLQNLASADEILRATGQGIDLASKIAGMFQQQQLQQLQQLQNLGFDIGGALGIAKDSVKFGQTIAGMVGQQELQNLSYQRASLQNLDPSPEEILKATEQGVKLASEIFKMFGQLQNLASADEILRATGQGLDLAGKIAGMFQQQQQLQQLQNLGFDLGGALGIAKDSVKFGQTIAGMVGQQEQQQMQLQELASAEEILKATGQGLDLAGKIGGGLGIF